MWISPKKRTAFSKNILKSWRLWSCWSINKTSFMRVINAKMPTAYEEESAWRASNQPIRHVAFELQLHAVGPIICIHPRSLSSNQPNGRRAPELLHLDVREWALFVNYKRYHGSFQDAKFNTHEDCSRFWELRDLTPSSTFGSLETRSHGLEPEEEARYVPVSWIYLS